MHGLAVIWSLFPLSGGVGAFSYNGPKLWNAAAFIRNTASLDCFKKLLKTQLLSKAFNL